MTMEIIRSYGIVRLIPKLDLNKVYVEITNTCNFGCVTCVRNSWKDDEGCMPFTRFDHLTTQLNGFPSVSTIHFGGYGEPLFHKDFPNILDRACDAGFDIELTTNGSLLSVSLMEQIVARQVKKVTVSIDSPVEEKFREIRGSGLAAIINNLRTLNLIKKKHSVYPIVGIAFVIMKKNIEEFAHLAALLKDTGVSYVNISHLLPHTKEMKEQICYGLNGRISGSDANEMLPGITTIWPEAMLRTERRCPFLSMKACAVSWDGEVSPCLNYMHSYSCFIMGRDKEIKKASFGNVFDSSLTDIWMSSPYVHFRAKLAEFCFPSCTDCDLNDGCNYTKSNEMDCWANSPTCSDCLYSRRILRCP